MTYTEIFDSTTKTGSFVINRVEVETHVIHIARFNTIFRDLSEFLSKNGIEFFDLGLLGSGWYIKFTEHHEGLNKVNCEMSGIIPEDFNIVKDTVMAKLKVSPFPGACSEVSFLLKKIFLNSEELYFSAGNAYEVCRYNDDPSYMRDFSKIKRRLRRSVTKRYYAEISGVTE